MLEAKKWMKYKAKYVKLKKEFEQYKKEKEEIKKGAIDEMFQKIYEINKMHQYQE